MASFEYDVVGKIGSMALIRKQDNDIDYNIIARLGDELRPGMIWVSSGATEIGRLDYIKRNGRELTGDMADIKTDYASQGQSILMENYRRFINSSYSVRQLLVEHTHFNDPVKRERIKQFLLRAREQNAIPIVNYNDPVSYEENIKMEIAALRKNDDDVVECIDNDETASVIASLVKSRLLVIMTVVDGIYMDPSDPSTIIREITANTPEELEKSIKQYQKNCVGASRPGAHGAYAKLQYILKPAMNGTTVIIGNAKYRLSELMAASVPCTVISLK